MDWKKGAEANWWNPYDYWQSISNTQLVGKQISLTIDAINEEFKDIDIKTKTHLVGFSLGAHVAGVAGYNQNGSLARITGLDPAGPSFGDNKMDAAHRLDKTDANYVDIIHTSYALLGGLPIAFTPLSSLLKVATLRNIA